MTGSLTVSEPRSGSELHCGRRGSLQVLHAGRVEYERALAMQERLVEAKIAGDERDYLLLLEHEAVYTLGRGANEADLLEAPARRRVPVFRVGRGGGVTFHGPGQLVAYPILRLPRGGRDVHRYVRTLETIVVATCRRFGVEAMARPGLTGVWVGEQKIASIGVGVRRWITYHGLAVNVSTEIGYFNDIVTCRMPGLVVTSLEKTLGRAVSVPEVVPHLTECFVEAMGYDSFERKQVG